MSTNHTPNYNLCQWEAADQVLRSDFNQDNAKIDAALKKVDDRGLQLIREFVTTEAKNPTVIDLSDINWSEWKTVHVDVIPGQGSSENVLFCYFGMNDNVGTISPTWNHMMLCPFGREDMPLSGIFWGKTCSLFHLYNIPFRYITRLNLLAKSGSDLMAVGTKVIIRGEKM